MPVLWSINELGRVCQADHGTPWAANACVRTAHKRAWFGTVALSSSADTLWVEDQRAGDPATARGDGIPVTAAAWPLQWLYTVHLHYLIRFDLMKTRNKTVSTRRSTPSGGKRKVPRKKQNLSPGQAGTLEENSAAKILHQRQVREGEQRS